MPSQSPLTGSTTLEYSQAWAATNRLIREGKSWSGREPNTLYLNAGDRSFADISFASGAAFPDDARAVAPVDWDDDGDLDFWVANRTAPKVRYLRNDAGNSSRSIALLLRGTKVNRDAVGSRVDVRVGEQRQVQLRQAGNGYLAQKTAWITFGVGQAERVDELVVRWPDGSEQRFRDVATGTRYTLVQGEQALKPVTPRSTAAARGLAVSEPKAVAPTSAARIALVKRRPLPEMSITDAAGRAHSLGGRPLLVNFWTSTCSNCIAELNAWNTESETWRKSGLAILALSVEAPEAGGVPGAARTLMQRLEPSYSWGTASDAWLHTFNVLQRWIVDRQDEMRVPTSFLIDAQRRLAYVYRGPVSAAQLATDVATLALDDEAFARAAQALPGRRAHAAGLPGMVDIAGELFDGQRLDEASFYLELGLAALGAPTPGEPLHQRAAAALTKLAGGYLEAKRPAEAVARLERAVSHDASNASSWFTLGEARARLNQKLPAIEALRRATELDAGLAAAWLRLGALLNETNEPAAAIEALRSATRAAPDDGRAWFTLGGTYLAQHAPADALPCFRKSTELQPQHALSWTGLGTCLAFAGDKPGALQALRRALELDPQDQRAKAMLEQLQSTR